MSGRDRMQDDATFMHYELLVKSLHVAFTELYQSSWLFGSTKRINTRQKSWDTLYIFNLDGAFTLLLPLNNVGY